MLQCFRFNEFYFFLCELTCKIGVAPMTNNLILSKTQKKNQEQSLEAM
jgi:hypothetical protein